ncbi:MAG: D-alanine--D-alanine ligase family protein, partial [Bdellovibrionia bacterium]
MKNAKKLRIMVIYGGKSGEHEVSLRSAASVIRYLDRTRFDVIPVGIDKKGVWRLGDFGMIEKCLIDKSQESLTIYENAPVVVAGDFKSLAIDVVFPVMHGPLCEDGAIQGLFELGEVPYVGSGVLGSAAGMDKDVAKRLARDGGLPIVPFIALKKSRWQQRIQDVQKQVDSQLSYPVFVKPANLGSSVGVHKVKEPSQLKAAIDDAFRYDTKVLIEKAVNAREIEFAVLESANYGDPAMVSVPGEIAPTHEFYSYEAK